MELKYNDIPFREIAGEYDARAVGFVEHFPDFIYAERDLSVVHVPGRNGDIIYDDGSFRNVLVSYDIACKYQYGLDDWIQSGLGQWLYPYEKAQYLKLEDSTLPYQYRLAIPNGQPIFKNIYGKNARGTVTFNCRPEKFFYGGDDPIVFTTTSGTIDTSDFKIRFPAKPLITVTIAGSGAFAIYKTGGNLYRVAIDDVTGTVILDCDSQEATMADGTNINSHITLTGFGSYPVIEPGSNPLFAMTGDISKVEIVPRYYDI